MQKVYLLLRNNQQTGPHSLEDLLQLNLKPFDLIWVEGKSYGWCYPTEIDTLKPFIASLVGATKIEKHQETTPAESISVLPNQSIQHKKIFVSLPVTGVATTATSSEKSYTDSGIEQRAEALRLKAQSFNSQSHEQINDIRTNYNRNLADVEEDYTSWVFRKKAKRKTNINKKTAIVVGISIMMLAVAWGIMHLPKHENAVTQLIVQNNADEKISPLPTQPTALLTVVPEKSINENSILPKELSSSRVTKKNEPKKQIPTAVTVKNTIQGKAILQQTQLPASEKTQNETAAVTEEKKDVAVVEKPKEKRTLKTLFNTLFKKNKKENSIPQQPMPADNSNNQRMATRRDEQNEVVNTNIDLSDKIEIAMNKTGDDWMMGVQGLKLTLYNRSNAVLKAATVQVSYYSDANNLLDKKVLSFSNIAPGRSQTLPAPDHKLADHADYKIITAFGEANAYAKQ